MHEATLLCALSGLYMSQMGRGSSKELFFKVEFPFFSAYFEMEHGSRHRSMYLSIYLYVVLSAIQGFLSSFWLTT